MELKMELETTPHARVVGIENLEQFLDQAGGDLRQQVKAILAMFDKLPEHGGLIFRKDGRAALQLHGSVGNGVISVELQIYDRRTL
jgi:hypothetical protein